MQHSQKPLGLPNTRHSFSSYCQSTLIAHTFDEALRLADREQRCIIFFFVYVK